MPKKKYRYVGTSSTRSPSHLPRGGIRAQPSYLSWSVHWGRRCAEGSKSFELGTCLVTCWPTVPGLPAAWWTRSRNLGVETGEVLRGQFYRIFQYPCQLSGFLWVLDINEHVCYSTIMLNFYTCIKAADLKPEASSKHFVKRIFLIFRNCDIISW